MSQAIADDTTTAPRSRAKALRTDAAQSPSVLNVGRQIVRLSDSYQAMGEEQSKLCRAGLSSADERRRERALGSQMRRNYDQENALVDAALAMRAETLLDVAVMLRLAWRVLDIEVCSEYDEKESEGRQANRECAAHLDRRHRERNRLIRQRDARLRR